VCETLQGMGIEGQCRAGVEREQRALLYTKADVIWGEGHRRENILQQGYPAQDATSRAVSLP
jgi:hypothetical protein